MAERVTARKNTLSKGPKASKTTQFNLAVFICNKFNTNSLKQIYYLTAKARPSRTPFRHIRDAVRFLGEILASNERNFSRLMPTLFTTPKSPHFRPFWSPISRSGKSFGGTTHGLFAFLGGNGLEKSPQLGRPRREESGRGGRLADVLAFPPRTEPLGTDYDCGFYALRLFDPGRSTRQRLPLGKIS